MWVNRPINPNFSLPSKSAGMHKNAPLLGKHLAVSSKLVWQPFCGYPFWSSSFIMIVKMNNPMCAFCEVSVFTVSCTIWNGAIFVSAGKRQSSTTTSQVKYWIHVKLPGMATKDFWGLFPAKETTRSTPSTSLFFFLVKCFAQIPTKVKLLPDFNPPKQTHASSCALFSVDKTIPTTSDWSRFFGMKDTLIPKI